jgi:hypothetical protein
MFVEHAFGQLKDHFLHLHWMTGQYLKEMYQIIEALMIIHNMLEEFGDDPITVWGFNGLEDDDMELVRGEALDWINADLEADDL